MQHLFVNGPVQNGPFTFETKPGKAVGIHLAAALNTIIGAAAAPHLWNTVTLAGDLRYRESAETSVDRRAFEADLIATKYPIGQTPVSGVMTDDSPEVAGLAMEIIENNLRDSNLVLSREVISTCGRCGHMTGGGHHSCRACGSADTVVRTGLHLVAELAKNRPVLDRSDIHADHRRQPKHLQNNVGNSATRLILSRTRDHGIDLAPIGLPGLVLDPRAGIHITALAAARRLEAATAVMTITQNAANHVAAHGQHFRAYCGTRLQYAIHGHVPYGDAEDLLAAYEVHAAGPGTRNAFETWFLPLFSLKQKDGVHPGQLAAVFKHFMRALRVQPLDYSAADLETVRSDITSGNTAWITSRPKLAIAVAATALCSQHSRY